MRILVVEDEHRIASSIKKGLEQESYAVDVAYDGINGYDLASTEEYCVLIIDLMIPGINGLELCGKLRKDGIHTPILILTAKSQIEDKVEGLNRGADDYLTKPFSFEELLARIRALIRRPRQTISTILSCNDVQLDTNSFTVMRGTTPIALTNKEYAFIEYMLRHQNKILTKEQIIRHVWNYDADILPNTVEVYVRNLRRKIDTPFKGKKSFIQTVRGFGYKIGD